MTSPSTRPPRAFWPIGLSRHRQVLPQARGGNYSAIFEWTVFFAALATFMTVIPFGDFDTIIGDNIAQVGYWRILFDHTFVGSLGASTMKPGLIVLLGAAHDLSLAAFESTILIKLVFALSGAGLATIVACMARQGGGKIAGVGAVVYMMAATPVPSMFRDGTSMIVFFPLLFWGVWLFSRSRDAAGAIVLCLAALIRIEAFAVLLWLAVAEQLFRRRWRAFSFSTLVVSITVAFTVLVFYRLQGSVTRFNAGGPNAGYLFSHEPRVWFRFLSALKYPASASLEMAFDQCRSPYLAIPALFGFAFNPGRRIYLSLLGIPLFLLVYFSAGEGGQELRYFQFVAPAIAAFGAAGIVQAYRLGRRYRASTGSWPWVIAALGGTLCFVFVASKPAGSLSLIFIAAGFGGLLGDSLRAFSPSLPRAGLALLIWVYLLVTLENNDWGSAPKRAAYTIDALDLLKNERVPRGQRILTEDDMIYGVLARDKAFFGHATALQYFNVQDDARRAQILAATDYIVVSRRRFSMYYLRYDPLQRKDGDPFRAAIAAAHKRRRKPVSVYGSILVPIQVSRHAIVLKVEPQPSAG